MADLREVEVLVVAGGGAGSHDIGGGGGGGGAEIFRTLSPGAGIPNAISLLAPHPPQKAAFNGSEVPHRSHCNADIYRSSPHLIL